MRARRAVTALACAPVLLLGLATAAQAAWTTGESVTTRLTTASFSYPGGVSQPAAPVLDGSVLSWAPTVVSGGRAMTGYAVTAVDSTTGASSSVPCALVIGTTVTCSGVPADLLTGYRFTEQPRYRGWAGSVSALSDELPEAPVPTTPTADAPADPVPSLDVPVEPDTATTADPTVTPTPDLVPEATPEQATPTPDPTEGPVVPETAPEAPNPP